VNLLKNASKYFIFLHKKAARTLINLTLEKHRHILEEEEKNG